MTKSTTEPIVQPANLDKEAGGGMRLLEGPYKKAAAIIAVLFSVFAIYSNGLSNIQEIYRNLIFLGILLVMTFSIIRPENLPIKKGLQPLITYLRRWPLQVLATCS